ncbi:MAG: UxaA family hydrolase [Halodesulfurarchaeum sp.]
MTINGYRRDDGSVGVRDYVAVLPTVGCVNVAAMRIAEQVASARPFLHHQGCCQLSPDLETVRTVLTGLGRNPNVKAVLLVSLGCESVSAEEIQAAISPYKPVELVRLQELGGLSETVSEGVSLVESMASIEAERVEVDVSDLTIGVKCGASDTTSGLAANPAVGRAIDTFVDAGATAIFGETTEVMGAEHVLSKRAVTDSVAEEIYQKVTEMEERADRFGVDMRGGQPTEGNIKGGLTTIEDKSLGAIQKSGSRPIDGVLEYGESPTKSGLYFMDSPGREMEFLTGPTAAGAQIILFPTGIGAPQGFPLVPVIKITGNTNTASHLEEHIDLDVSQIISGTESTDEAGERVVDSVRRVADGERVKAEVAGYDDAGTNSAIYVCGPVI